MSADLVMDPASAGPGPAHDDACFAVVRDPLCVADFNGRILRVNAKWREVFGHDASAGPGRRLRDFLHPEDRMRAFGAMRRLLATGGVEGVAIRARIAQRDRRLTLSAGIDRESRQVYVCVREAAAADERAAPVTP